MVAEVGGRGREVEGAKSRNELGEMLEVVGESAERRRWYICARRDVSLCKPRYESES
jgi:hypothetical protein